MLKELLDGLVVLARKSQAPSVLAGTPEPRHLYRIIDANGIVGEVEQAAAEPRGYVLHTIEDAVVAIKRMLREEIATPQETLVFCGRGTVCVCLDENHGRREWLKILLPESHEFNHLKGLEKDRPAMVHRNLVKCLRIDLAGAVSAADLARFRSLKFKNSAGGTSDVQQGKDSLGKDVQYELMCDGTPPPDEIALRVCCYRDLASDADRRAIRCAVDVDLSEMTIALIPVAGELERIQRETDAWIKGELISQLEGTEVEVLCGNPWK